MTISTNSEPKLYRNLYEKAGRKPDIVVTSLYDSTNVFLPYHVHHNMWITAIIPSSKIKSDARSNGAQSLSTQQLKIIQDAE